MTQRPDERHLSLVEAVADTIPLLLLVQLPQREVLRCSIQQLLHSKVWRVLSSPKVLLRLRSSSRPRVVLSHRSSLVTNSNNLFISNNNLDISSNRLDISSSNNSNKDLPPHNRQRISSLLQLALRPQRHHRPTFLLRLFRTKIQLLSRNRVRISRKGSSQR
jgi:hypothetical protein